jgi:hypothetical protein
MAQGEATDVSRGRRESILAVAPPALLGAVALLLGLWVPPGLADVAHEAARAIGGA